MRREVKTRTAGFYVCLTFSRRTECLFPPPPASLWEEKKHFFGSSQHALWVNGSFPPHSSPSFFYN